MTRKKGLGHKCFKKKGLQYAIMVTTQVLVIRRAKQAPYKNQSDVQYESKVKYHNASKIWL